MGYSRWPELAAVKDQCFDSSLGIDRDTFLLTGAPFLKRGAVQIALNVTNG